MNESASNGRGVPMRWAAAPDVLSVQDVAQLLNVDRKLVYAAVSQGQIPAARIGQRTIRISKEKLGEWLAASGIFPT